MTQYTYVKQINSSRLVKEITAAGLTNLDHIDTFGPTVVVCFVNSLSDSQKTVLDTIISNHILETTREMIDAVITDAIAFGNTVKKDFVAENVMLGITQRGLTGHVRKMLREVKDAMESGSLYDAITEIKSLNPDDFDNAIVTPARILVFRNKIETYLHVPLATSWDQSETWL